MDLTPRTGERPETNPTPPHLQMTQTSPQDIWQALSDWVFSAFENVRDEPTRISVPGVRALWLDEKIDAPQDVFMPTPGSREFAHLHKDGSMHIMLAPDDEKAVLEAGWGELHPYHDRGVKEILIYAPRDAEELELIKSLVARSYDYVMASGAGHDHNHAH